MAMLCLALATVTAACGDSGITTYHDPNGVDVTIGSNVNEPVVTYGADTVQRTLDVDRLRARLGAAQIDPAHASEHMGIASTELIPLVSGALGVRDASAANRFIAAWNQIAAHASGQAAITAFNTGAVMAAHAALTPPNGQADPGWSAAEVASVLDDATSTLEQSLSDAPDVQNASQRLFARQLLQVAITTMPELRLNADQTAQFTGRLERVSTSIERLPAGAVKIGRAERLSERISTLNDDLTTAANIDTTAPETTKLSLAKATTLLHQVRALQAAQPEAGYTAQYPQLVRRLQQTSSGIATIDPSAVGRMDRAIGMSLRHAITGSPLPATIDATGTRRPSVTEDIPTILVALEA
ncbi:MAG: hypothetical protein H7123_09380, partial [Thermoleophilia bacterium]|nr:hypothetical protein [Thermoleophilia bacterium]